MKYYTEDNSSITQHDIDDTVLYLTNTRDFYDFFEPYRRSMARRINRKTYDHVMAVIGLRNQLRVAISSLKCPLASDYRKLFDVMNENHKMTIADKIMDRWGEEINDIASEINRGLRDGWGNPKPIELNYDDYGKQSDDIRLLPTDDRGVKLLHVSKESYEAEMQRRKSLRDKYGAPFALPMPTWESLKKA